MERDKLSPSVLVLSVGVAGGLKLGYSTKQPVSVLSATVCSCVALRTEKGEADSATSVTHDMGLLQLKLLFHRLPMCFPGAKNSTDAFCSQTYNFIWVNNYC